MEKFTVRKYLPWWTLTKRQTLIIPQFTGAQVYRRCQRLAKSQLCFSGAHCGEYWKMGIKMHENVNVYKHQRLSLFCINREWKCTICGYVNGEDLY